ncbi:cytochrome-c oxidase, cbb3-type subunit III [uncultured Erythrobacter sp.]|uniref:cytochrome-c oxidase, cbb3-type subunit III n=1 Tax=uncultured Erythrobacter sp. TaxID=263913 RepID=UPI00262AFBDC|nr:cytochrome-c oxidase, cbb3-type subunit III [uncultured Erythrobacter sp.]
MADNKRIDEPTGTEFVGHEWDGIEELNTPLPRWWLWTFYATIAWALVYVVMYPAWPLVSKATEGVLGWSSRGELAQELRDAQLARAETFELIAATDLTELSSNPELMGQAISGGAAAFKQHCVQCHGAGAAGYAEYGYPNLNDDDWLWGGELSEIEFTLTHGIRWEGSDQTRFNMMPAYGDFMNAGEIDALTAHALSLSGKAQSSAQGAQLYDQNCAACHMADGSGSQELGAPALNDAIWLYGDDPAQVRAQIAQPRHGVMPGWSDKLDPVTIRMLAAYIHSRGGGEATIEEPSDAEPIASESVQAAAADKAEADERL